jgi:hypothetical protein
MPVLIQNLVNVLAYNQKRNEKERKLENKLMDADTKFIINFFESLQKINQSIKNKKFIDAFEETLKMKMKVNVQKELNTFFGDADLGLAINAILLRLSSSFFNLFEALEKKYSHEFDIIQKKLT